MNKLNILLLIGLLLSLRAHSDNFIDEDAVWHYNWDNYNGAGLEEISYDRDTVIDGQPAKVLIRKQYSLTLNSDHEIDGYESYELDPLFIYSVGAEVYYYNGIEETFSMLYDFSANPDDTWDLGVDTNFMECGASILHVKDTGTTEISGESRRLLEVEPDSLASYGLNGPLIEGIGATDHHLLPQGRSCDNTVIHPNRYTLKCYEDASTPLHKFSEDDCKAILSTNLTPVADNDKISITLFPNPARDEVTIDAHDGKHRLQSVSIVDMTGRTLIESKEATFDISGLNTGVYIVTAAFEQGETVRERLRVK